MPWRALRGLVSSQQRKEEREREQCGHTLPKSDRSAFIERQRPALRNRGARGSRLHLDREFHHVLKSLGRIDCDRLPECILEPGREVGAQTGERLRSLSLRPAGGIGIAVGKLSGEGAEYRDTPGVNV